MTLFFKIIISLTPLVVTVLGFSVGVIQMTQTVNSEIQRANYSFNSGLQGSYFVLPNGVSELSEIDFDRAPDATGVVSALDHAKSDTPFWEGGPTDKFAARYTGALQVETAGTYTFYLTSDDGSALSLDGAQVIDNDGAHATTTREVTLDLAAGEHALEVLYFENGGVQTLE
ncbi:MAG: PA14 domain-containing protein, partial [Gammaproteobacteria bacterium]